VVGDGRMMAKLNLPPMQDTLAALHCSFSHRLIHPRCLKDKSAGHLQKFSDGTAVFGCIQNLQEVEYRVVKDDFVEWEGRNHRLTQDHSDGGRLQEEDHGFSTA